LQVTKTGWTRRKQNWNHPKHGGEIRIRYFARTCALAFVRVPPFAGAAFLSHAHTSQIHCIYERYRLYAAIVVSVGTMSALMQNEAVINGTASQTQLNLLKALKSVCTVICLLMIIRIYWLNILLSRVLEHVTHLNTLISGHVMTEIFTDPVLWLELGIVGVHCPPFFEYSYGTTIQGNYQVYEIETVFGCLNLLRLYLVWRVVVDWMLGKLSPNARDCFVKCCNFQPLAPCV